MQLCIDIGNTSTSYGLFQKRDLVQAGKLNSDTQWTAIIEKFRPTICGVSNVSGPEKFGTLPEELNCLVIDHKTPLPVKIQYSTPETLGSDRICAAAGAHCLYPDNTVLSIDLGTCIKYELVTADGIYIGGNIGPGMNMRFKALNRDTAKLPLVSYSIIEQEMGRSTEEAIRNGVQLGMICEMDAMIDRMKALYPDLITVMTGGDLPHFENALKTPIFAHPLLVLQGLNEITIFNQTI